MRFFLFFGSKGPYAQKIRNNKRKVVANRKPSCENAINLKKVLEKGSIYQVL